jgi:hypothetical protein
LNRSFRLNIASMPMCFSEADSNHLATHKEGVDHVIELQDGKASPGFCPLYNMSLDELAFVKE